MGKQIPILKKVSIKKAFFQNGVSSWWGSSVQWRMLDPARGHTVRKVGCEVTNANHLICESDLTSLIVCIFYEHVYCFISALTLSVCCHQWHLVRMLTLWQYMGLNILTWNIARVNSLSGEEINKLLWSNKLNIGSTGPPAILLCVSPAHRVSVPETFPEFVTRGHHHISHHIDFRAPQPFSQSQANFYYILSNTGSTPAAKHVSVSKSSLSLSCGIGMENWVSRGKN